MKIHNLTYLGGFAALAVAGLALSTQMDVDLGTEAIAETDTAVLTANCTEPTAAAFVPNITYTFVPTAIRAAVTCAGSTGTVANAVNSDSTVTPSCSISDVTGRAILRHDAVKFKMAGQQCSADINFVQLQSHDSNDLNDAKLDVAVQATGSTTWTEGQKIDLGTAAVKKMQYGAAGLVSTSKLSDGSDGDSFENGETVFGGASGSAGHMTFINVDIGDIATDASTESEVYTLTNAAS